MTRPEYNPELLPHVIWAKLAFRDDDCWEWTATRTRKGYGMIKWDGRGQPAHRVTYTILRGPIPEGLQLDHLCRNRWCCNPAHLEPVTNAENQRRGLKVELKTHCAQGHLWVPANIMVRSNGQLNCRICRRIWQKKCNDRRYRKNGGPGC